MCGDGTRAALLVLLGSLLATTAPAQLPDLKTQSTLPINLDAASSAFDRRNNRIVFQRLHIEQGALDITADVAEATRIDFENNRWQFRGNVVIEHQGTRVFSEHADLYFLGHELRSASLKGTPARFEQARPTGERTEGRAGAIDYDVTAGIVRLSRNAWLSDGANEVSGERITYDLRREYVTANSGGDGQIRMRIQPPPRDEAAESAP
jgi:lipopolysaccharide export system protein LptA